MTLMQRRASKFKSSAAPALLNYRNMLPYVTSTGHLSYENSYTVILLAQHNELRCNLEDSVRLLDNGKKACRSAGGCQESNLTPTSLICFARMIFARCRPLQNCGCFFGESIQPPGAQNPFLPLLLIFRILLNLYRHYTRLFLSVKCYLIKCKLD